MAEQVLCVLEDIYESIKRSKVNHKKCPKARLTSGYLMGRLQALEDYWKDFKSAHQELLTLIKREERGKLPYFSKGQYDTCEEEYFDLKGDLKDLLQPLLHPRETEASTSAIQTPVERAPQVKLPEINLCSFSGSYDEWQAFEDNFTALIINNRSLSNVLKLQYLKSCLTGEASATLKHYKITEANYLPAWEALKARYSHKRLVVNTIMKKLFNQKKIIVNSPSQLKSFVDTTRECLHGLQSMNISTDSWDSVIIFLSTQKLDPESHKDWEDHISSICSDDELPTFNQLTTFLEKRIRTLELTNTAPQKTFKEKSFHVAEGEKTYERTCSYCKERHPIWKCKEFGKISTQMRNEFVTKENLCYNCLLPNHSVQNCRSTSSCRLCRRRHHSLLHLSNRGEPSGNEAANHVTDGSNNSEVDEELDEQAANFALSSHFTTKKSTGLLATALVNVKSATGNTIVLRALIDIGSQASFVSERAAQSLNIKRTAINGSVTGVGSSRTLIKHFINLEIQSRVDTHFSIEVKTYVMQSNLTNYLPSKIIQVEAWTHIDGLSLADPSFFQPGRIDILLGVDVCASILQGEIIKGPPGTPMAQNTNLGWILFGRVGIVENSVHLTVMHHRLEIDKLLKQFWEIDSSEKRTLTATEKRCEELYETTTTRNADGRYIVKLPTARENLLSTQGNTRAIALKRLLNLEKRFERDPKLKLEYTQVLNEYLTLNHMEEVPNEELDKPSVYLSHHAVVREDKETSKTRIVFDASCKGLNNVSLNDELLVGPQIQEDLRSLIMRWRMKKICFVADITKMYRQIMVSKTDADLQRILWRDNDKVKDYRMLRVTFGTACASFLAVRTLAQIAKDEGKNYPEAQKTIVEDFYMDDLMSGCDTVEEAIDQVNNISMILSKGGLPLQKWCSNNAEVLRNIEPSLITTQAKLNIHVDGVIRALGISWNISSDTFNYHLELAPIPEIVTKRNILSDLQKLFDPLGWLIPAIIPAKIIIQSLWLEGINWDDEVNLETKEKWLKFRNSLTFLRDIQIPRWLSTNQTHLENVTLHGFCDASLKAYGAVVYIRVQLADKVETKVIAARARVSPIRPVTLPRLELSGGLLLSRLMKTVRESMRIPITQTYCWTDSSVVLSWLLGDPARWSTFVSNRVIEILENTGNRNWFHVSSGDNPADISSRGTDLSELLSCSLWWEGPPWLKESNFPLTRLQNCSTDIEERKTIHVNVKINDEKIIDFEKFANLNELIKTVATAVIFLNANKRPEKVKEALTPKDMEDALERCIRIVQEEDFADEISRVKEKKNVRKDSKIKSLNPYLDAKNILRVGGRLRAASIPEETKHPIIIGNKNKLVPLLVEEAHHKTLHGGTQLMMNYLRSKFWILRSKGLIKQYTHRCVTCIKYRTAVRDQIMGDLPKVRVTPARPFLNSGVDFAGPLLVLMSRGRGAKTYKAYISLFICMVTKAIHLELVGDMTSEAFIGAFKRFVARRGKCINLWSDQGKNFIGANKELKDAFDQAKLDLPTDIIDILATDGTRWHFNPPYSPNFGGLWEAGVKSIKWHLKRILNCSLTFEEMSTVLTQIEACLNSRPLCPIDDSDPNNLEPLTPGHFLIGEAPITIPDVDYKDVNTNKLSRWQLTQKLYQSFWRRWQDEYLTRLLERPKWQRPRNDLDVGDIVLIIDSNTPPGKWKLGRIVQKHSGPDGVTRVYSVRSGNKVTQRSVSKLRLLPINYE